jgi:hypothetical protein
MFGLHAVFKIHSWQSNVSRTTADKHYRTLPFPLSPHPDPPLHPPPTLDFSFDTVVVMPDMKCLEDVFKK